MTFVRRPNALVTIDGRPLTAPEAGLSWLQVWLGDDSSHDRVEFLVWADSKFVDTPIAAPIRVALGEMDDEEDVFAGEVTALARRHDGVWIEGLASTVALSRERTAKTYSEQSVADIVRDLGGALVGEAEAKTRLSAYSVDPCRPIWSWVCELADLTGAQLTSTSEGLLRFVPVATGIADHTLYFGSDLLAWEIADTPPPAKQAIAAHGSASEAGSDKWHWLRREPMSNGDGTPRVVAAFHSREAATELADALAARSTRQVRRGVVVAHGQPTVRAGDLVELADVPAAADVLRVRRLEHHLDPVAGFVSVMHVEGSSGGLGPLGGLL